MFLARLHVGVVTDLAGIPFPVYVGVVTDLAGIPLTTGTRVKVVGWRDIFGNLRCIKKRTCCSLAYIMLSYIGLT